MSRRHGRYSMPTGVAPLQSFQSNSRTSFCSKAIAPASNLRCAVTSLSDRNSKSSRTRNNPVPITTLSWETSHTWMVAETREGSSPRTRTSSLDRCKTCRERIRRQRSSPIHLGTLLNSHPSRSSTSRRGGGLGNDSSWLSEPPSSLLHWRERCLRSRSILMEETRTSTHSTVRHLS